VPLQQTSGPTKGAALCVFDATSRVQAHCSRLLIMHHVLSPHMPPHMQRSSAPHCPQRGRHSQAVTCRQHRLRVRPRASRDDLPPPPDVVALAKMARVDVSAEEAAAWAPKISAIVQWCAAPAACASVELLAQACSCRMLLHLTSPGLWTSLAAQVWPPAGCGRHWRRAVSAGR